MVEWTEYIDTFNYYIEQMSDSYKDAVWAIKNNDLEYAKDCQCDAAKWYRKAYTQQALHNAEMHWRKS